MLTCEVCTEDEISYNPAISTCEKDEQCPVTYRAAEEQCVRSSDLKPAGAKTAHLEPSGVPPGGGGEVLAARATIEHAEEKKTENSENKHGCFFRL